jgi:hypothetical protein
VFGATDSSETPGPRPSTGVSSSSTATRRAESQVLRRRVSDWVPSVLLDRRRRLLNSLQA